MLYDLSGLNMQSLGVRAGFAAKQVMLLTRSGTYTVFAARDFSVMSAQ